jgi:hypothetical protein
MHPASAETTGVALITVDASGENGIVVAPGANDELRPEDVDLPDCDGVLCQLEIPLETVEHIANTAPGDFFLNAAPARGPVPAADVTIVNRYELEAVTHHEGVIVVTHGAEGAIMLENGEEVARATPPPDEVTSWAQLSVTARPVLVPAYLILLHQGWFGALGRYLGAKVERTVEKILPGGTVRGHLGNGLLVEGFNALGRRRFDGPGYSAGLLELLASWPGPGTVQKRQACLPVFAS